MKLQIFPRIFPRIFIRQTTFLFSFSTYFWCPKNWTFLLLFSLLYITVYCCVQPKFYFMGSGCFGRSHPHCPKKPSLSQLERLQRSTSVIRFHISAAQISEIYRCICSNRDRFGCYVDFRIIFGTVHRRMIHIEEKAKVVTAVWGTEFIQCLATLAVLDYRTIWRLQKDELNKADLKKGWILPILQNRSSAK